MTNNDVSESEWKSHLAQPSVDSTTIATPALEGERLQHQADQRANTRYPINLVLRYKLLKHGRVDQLGSGRTLNISSRGVLFEVDASCPAGSEIELKMNWPFLLDGICHLKLVMHGHIVRYDVNAKAAAVKAEHHEFYTAGRDPNATQLM